MVRNQVRAGLIAFSALVMLLTLSACDADALARQMEQTSVAEDAMRSPALDDLHGRLLVLGGDGNIFTADPSGDNRVAITADASSTITYQQPTWSPDSALIAWTEVRTESDDDIVNHLVTSNADGSNLANLEAPFPPFYYYWSPDGKRLAYLSSWNRADNLPSMALRLVEIETSDGGARELTASTLAEGQPFYFSWAPDGQRLLTHIGNEQLDTRTIDGGSESLLSTPASFAAPQWSGDGSQLVFAVSEGDLQKLIITDTGGNLVDEITDFDARITFGLSPDAGAEQGKLAYVVTGNKRVETAALGPLFVVDLATKATREISSQPVVAFFWSPDGEKLAYLTLERTSNGAQARWQVWDGRESRAYDAIMPSARFLQRYLTFFDQYAQSMHIWSPDSRAFTYTGVGEDGRNGVWVQVLDEEEPSWVSRGVFAAWSPREDAAR